MYTEILISRVPLHRTVDQAYRMTRAAIVLKYGKELALMRDGRKRRAAGALLEEASKRSRTVLGDANSQE